MKATSEILDQLPPCDPEAERWVVGSVLIRPSALDDLGFIFGDDFRDENHAKLYGALVEMYRQGEPIGAEALLRRFPGDEWAARIGEIIHATPHGHDALYYARIVKQKAKLRELREIGLDLVRDAHGNEPPESVLERAEAGLAGITLGVGDGEPITAEQAVVDATCRIDAIMERGQSAGLPTGLPSFDGDMGGLFPGELTVLAARPGCGKTSLALQIAAHNAGRGRLVYFASLEMSATELVTRQACGDSGVSNRSVRIGKLTLGEQRELNAAFTRQSKNALEIHDRSALTVASIRREIRKRKKRGLALAVVDYLQLIAPEDRKLPREQQVARMVRQLKETSREYDVPILCLCQLNRQADADEIPRLSQLRESGAIEQDADVVLFLSHHEPAGREQHTAVLTVAKNRNGETGSLRLDWDGPRTRFYTHVPPVYDEFAEHAR